jgi:hypothetical protein
MNLHEKAEQVRQQGFCLFPGIYSASEIKQMQDLLDAHWEKMGKPKLEGFGMGIHPLMPVLAGLAPFAAKKEVIDTVRLVLGGEPRLLHFGARISDATSSANIGWHHHYSWDESLIPKRNGCERLLAAIYVDGANAASGPLVLLPRKYNEPIGPMRGGGQEDWPGQFVVDAPAGTAAIFDTTVWHTAKRGNTPTRRRIFGTHMQKWSDPRPHPEDNAIDVPEVQGFLKTDAVLRGLVKG